MANVDHVAPTSATTVRGNLRAASVYATATALRGAIGFLLLPLYTRVFTPAEYGRLAIILAITSAATIAFSFGLDFALFRNFFRLSSDKSAQRRLVNSLWMFLIVAPLGVALAVIVVVAPQLPSTAIIQPEELAIGLIGAAVFVSASTVPFALLRAQQRLRDYVKLSVVFTASSAIVTLIIVVGLDAGVRGWLLATLIANLIGFVAAVRIIPFRLPRPFDSGHVRNGLALGLPLIPHFLGHWGLLLADRAVLGGIVSSAAVGVYTLGATLALPALILVQALGTAFMPSYAAAAASDVDRERLRSITSVQAVSVMAICFSVALIGPSLVGLIAPAAYHGAVPLIPWIALGYAFLGLYSMPMNGLSLGMGRTKFVWLGTGAACCTNLGLIYLLVPAYGILAAAIASAAGYLALLGATSFYSMSAQNPVSYEWGRLLRAVGVIAVIYSAAVLTTDDTGLGNALARLAWLGLAGLGLFWSGGVALTIRAVVERIRGA